MLQWCSDFLLQPDGPLAGDPWEFTREQARITLRFYEIDAHGRFLHRRGVLRRLKGWGKDPFLAAIAGVELCGPCRFGGWDAAGLPVAVPHPAPWIQVAAVSREQTRNTMTLFPGLFSPAAVEEYGIDPGKEIIYARGGGRIEAVTSSPRALEGGRPSLVIINESHHWLQNNAGVDMASAIRRNLAKSRDGSARSMEITNAHLPGEGSVAEATYEAWLAAQGSGRPLKGVYYDSLEPSVAVDLEDRAGLVAALTAVRGDSLWVDVERVADEIADPTTPESIARRFYLNQVVAAEQTWVELTAWQACKADKLVAQGDRVCLGFDGAIRDDSTVLMACRLEDGHLFRVASWEKPDGPRGNGWQVPRDEVNAAVGQAMKDYDVVTMYADPPHWQDYVDRWAQEYGDTVVLEFWTMSAARMAKALERLHTAISAGELTHDGDEVLSRHVGNAIAVPRRGGAQVNKRSHTAKIDALVAATLAYEARNDAVRAGTENVKPVFLW